MTATPVDRGPDDAAAPTTPPDGPLVVACLRIGDLRPSVDPLDGSVTRDRLGVGLSPADAAALEHALRVAGAWSGRVVAVCAGPAVDRAGPPRGRQPSGWASSGSHLGDEGDGHRYVAELVEDERALARTLVAAVAPFGPPDLVLCGDRSVDRGTGALPAYLAHELGCAQALGLVAVEADPATRDLLVERRLDAGWRERLRVALPAVCSVEGAGVRLRRASLGGAVGMAGIPVPVDRSLGVADAAGPAASGLGGSTSARPGRSPPVPGSSPPPRPPIPACASSPSPGRWWPMSRRRSSTRRTRPGPPTRSLAFLARHGYLDGTERPSKDGAR